MGYASQMGYAAQTVARSAAFYGWSVGELDLVIEVLEAIHDQEVSTPLAV